MFLKIKKNGSGPKYANEIKQIFFVPHFMVVFDPSHVMLMTFEAWGTKIQLVLHHKQTKISVHGSFG